MPANKINIYLFLFLIYSVSCCNFRNGDKHFDNNPRINEKDIVEKIELQYVEMYMTTFNRVHCNQFGKIFSKHEKKTLMDLKEIKEFEFFLNKTIDAKQNKKNIDVRGKAKIYYKDNSIKELCFGLHTLEMDGVKYSISNEFMEYLLILTETE